MSSKGNKSGGGTSTKRSSSTTGGNSGGKKKRSRKEDSDEESSYHSSSDDEQVSSASSPSDQEEGEDGEFSSEMRKRESGSAPPDDEEGGGKSRGGDDDSEGDESDMGGEEAEEAEQLKMAALLQHFTPEQLARYEHFRRSHLKRSDVSKVMKAALGARDQTVVNERVTIVVGGIAKVYAGEMLELARTVMEEEGNATAVQPRHLREAYRRMRRLGKVPPPP